jgi:hypothetical protein
MIIVYAEAQYLKIINLVAWPIIAATCVGCGSANPVTWLGG